MSCFYGSLQVAGGLSLISGSFSLSCSSGESLSSAKGKTLALQINIVACLNIVT